MNEQLFRKKSMEKVSSPEQLNEYIRVSDPGVWMVLAAIVILLIGVCIWGVLGHLDTTVKTVAVAEKNQITLYIKETDIGSVKENTKVVINGAEYEIFDVAEYPVAVGNDFSEYVLHKGNLKTGEWVYPAVILGDEYTEGVYDAEIVIESVSPMSFVIN